MSEISGKLKSRIDKLPTSSGVYLFLSEDGDVLYIGKATSLRARVRQYFSGAEERSRGRRMAQLVAQIAQIKTRQTDSALEALILEANLIKKHQPKYNVLEKDDKSFSYFVITREEFPRLVILRKTDLQKAKYQTLVYTRARVFGPYTSRAHMESALKILRKIFPFHSRTEQSEKGCLEYQIGLCPGPYDGAISQQEYAQNIRGIRMVLSGGRKRLLGTLRREMSAASKAEEFELAGKLRNQITALTHIRDVALMTDDFAQFASGDDTRLRIECFDVSHLSGSATVASMVVAIDGEMSSADLRKFIVRDEVGGDDLRAMREVLTRRAGHWDDWGTPDAIVIDGGATHLAMAEELWKSLGVTVPLLAVAKGPTRRKVDTYPSHRYPPNPSITTNTKLLETLREEAHRVAISLHRARRDKSLFQVDKCTIDK